MSNKKTSTISNITLSPSEKYFDVKDVSEYPSISSITTNSSVRGFNPKNVPPGFIHLDRVNQMPSGGDFYAILPNSNNKISKITPYGLNKDTNKFSFLEGWRGKDWQSMLREPKYEIDLNDDQVYIYDPNRNGEIAEFIETQASARGKKKSKTIKYKSRRNKLRRNKSRKYKSRRNKKTNSKR